MREYELHFTRTTIDYQTVVIEAKSDEEADTKGRDIVRALNSVDEDHDLIDPLMWTDSEASYDFDDFECITNCDENEEDDDEN